MTEYSGPTEEYRDLAAHPEKIYGWPDEVLLKHYLNTRMMIEANDWPVVLDGQQTNTKRMGFVFAVERIEKASILTRMKEPRLSDEQENAIAHIIGHADSADNPTPETVRDVRRSLEHDAEVLAPLIGAAYVAVRRR